MAKLARQPVSQDGVGFGEPQQVKFILFAGADSQYAQSPNSVLSCP
jgi:hypothetical protein